MKVQCPFCEAILQPAIEQFIMHQDLFCNCCKQIIHLKNSDGSPVSMQFNLTEPVTKSRKEIVIKEVSVE